MALDNAAQVEKLKNGPIVEILIAEIRAFNRVCIRLGFDKERAELEAILKKLDADDKEVLKIL